MKKKALIEDLRRKANAYDVAVENYAGYAGNEYLEGKADAYRELADLLEEEVLTN